MAKLIVRGEDGAEREFSLDETGSLTIGRSPDCGIPIDDGQASRRHCSVVKLQSGYEVADLGSTNGTTLNGTLVKKQKLRHGDVIRIGACEIRFSDPDAIQTAGDLKHCALVYAKGDRKGDKVELSQQRTTIGRKPTNTLPITDVVASSYHCEIVRDLNGYTIRDLGSTNGTLVNNEMITEAQLTHGARIRVGNTRFVFQDPSMAEVDLELAGAEEDDEWGMMRDLDLAAVRKRNPATIVYTVLFVGILAALGYLMTREPGKAVATGPQAPKGNLHDAYSFESSATAFTWDSQPAGAVDISVTEKRKASGSSALQLKGNSPQAEAFYGTSLSGRNIRYKLTAKGGATGGKARFGLQWSGLGLDRWDVVELGSGLGAIEIVSSAPPWASSVRLGVRFETPATVTLDDVALVPQGSAASTNVEQNDFRITVTDGRALDVFHAGRPILANGRPIAFDSGGRALDASLTIQAAEADKEHVTVAIQGGGDAAMVGVELTEVAGYLARGGFRAFGDADGGTYYKGSFPETQRLDRSVRKLLVGPSGGAFAVIGNASNGRFESLAKTEGRTRTWTIRASAADGAATVRFKNDLRGETAEAQGALSQAQSLYNAKRYGEFLNQANRALAEFPFASRVLRDRLRDRVAEVNSEYAKILKSADSSLADYDEFRDVSSLDQVANALKTLRTLFQITPGEGPRGERLARLSNAAATRLNKALEKRHNEQAGAFMVQAEQLHLDQAPPEVYSAGLLFFHVSTFLSDSDKATDADAGLENISKSNPDLMRVLRKLGLKAGE